MAQSDRFSSPARYATFRHDVRWIIGLLILAGILAISFCLLARAVVDGDTAGFDSALLAFFHPANPKGGPLWLTEMARDVTSLGTFALLGFAAVAAGGYFLLARKPGHAVLIVTAVFGAELINSALKATFDRPRPEIPHAVHVVTASFPSGHAFLSAATFLTLAALLARTSSDWRIRIYAISLAIVMTALVGLSRLCLGVHYPSDVLAGWCMGSAWALLCLAAAAWVWRNG